MGSRNSFLAAAVSERIAEKDVVQVVGRQVSRSYTNRDGKKAQFTYITGATVGLVAPAKTGDDTALWLTPEETEGETQE